MWKVLGFRESAWSRWRRVGRQAVRGFWKDRCSLYVSSMTFYTLMSIVPFFALVLAMAGELGVKEHLRSTILHRFQEQKEVLAEVIAFAEKMLEQVQGGVFAAGGAVLLFWSVGGLFKSLEDAFNRIWGAKQRKWKRALIDYGVLLVVGPLLFLLLSSAAMVFSKGPMLLISCATCWLVFAALFLFMPNTRVQLSSAILAGAIATLLYLIVQEAYIFFQKGLSRYGAIYGSFAALPLFLIWVQLSWSIVLMGGELSCAHQGEKDG